jgi:23S rRNA pseudouridine2605 synthase
VSRLRRVRYGPVELPARLAEGRWLELPPEKSTELALNAGLK